MGCCRPDYSYFTCGYSNPYIGVHPCGYDPCFPGYPTRTYYNSCNPWARHTVCCSPMRSADLAAGAVALGVIALLAAACGI